MTKLEELVAAYEAAYAVAQVDWEVAAAAACYAEDLDEADGRRDAACAAAEAAYNDELIKTQKDRTHE